MTLIDIQTKANELSSKQICAEFTSKVCRLSDLDSPVDGNAFSDEELATFIETYIAKNPELFIVRDERVELPRNAGEEIFDYFRRVFMVHMEQQNERFKNTASSAVARLNCGFDITNMFKDPSKVKIPAFSTPAESLNGIMGGTYATAKLAEKMKKVGGYIAKPEVRSVYHDYPKIDLPPNPAHETNNLLKESVQHQNASNLKLEAVIAQIELSRLDNKESFGGTTNQNTRMIFIGTLTLIATIVSIFVTIWVSKNVEVQKDPAVTSPSAVQSAPVQLPAAKDNPSAKPESKKPPVTAPTASSPSAKKETPEQSKAQKIVEKSDKESTPAIEAPAAKQDKKEAASSP
jgi:hypothetical protein